MRACVYKMRARVYNAGVKDSDASIKDGIIRRYLPNYDRIMKNKKESKAIKCQALFILI